MLDSEKLAEILGESEVSVKIEFALDTAKDLICGYCHVDRVPRALENTAYRMAMDIMRNEGSDNNGPVSSITEGDVSVSFGGADATAFTNSIMKNYEKQLNPFRKLVFNRDSKH